MGLTEEQQIEEERMLLEVETIRLQSKQQSRENLKLMIFLSALGLSILLIFSPLLINGIKYIISFFNK